MHITTAQRELLENMGWHRLIRTATGQYTLRNHELTEVGYAPTRVVNSLLKKGLVQEGETSIAGFTLMTITPDGWTAVDLNQPTL